MKRKIAALLLCVSFALPLTGCYTETDLERARQEGYDEGYSDAMQTAEDDHHDEMNAKEEEMYENMRDAYDLGYDDGINGREYGDSY